MMPLWMRTLIKVWKGELIEEERKKSKEIQDDSRESIKCGKAMLDGEEYWLIPECKEQDRGVSGE